MILDRVLLSPLDPSRLGERGVRIQNALVALIVAFLKAARVNRRPRRLVAGNPIAAVPGLRRGRLGCAGARARVVEAPGRVSDVANEDTEQGDAGCNHGNGGFGDVPQDEVGGVVLQICQFNIFEGQGQSSPETYISHRKRAWEALQS